MTKKKLVLLSIMLLTGVYCFGQNDFPAISEGDYQIKNFKFESGESLPIMNIHYTTLGKPIKDKNGQVLNAILIMHGTTVSGHSFLTKQFAGHLFNPGQPLDASKYFIILPDAIGHGNSSKPSDSLRMNFPKYTYDDMVKANYILIREHLGVNHLRLVMGTSMGGMETWILGYTYPNFMDALMPLASEPVEIAGRNRMFRKAVINCVESDPQWQGGTYEKEPKAGLTGAASAILSLIGGNQQWQRMAPNRQTADSLLLAMTQQLVNRYDANNLIYQFDASRNYNPAPHLSKIEAPLFAVNSADDEIEPPELKLTEQEISKVKKGRYILLPVTDETIGHGTCYKPEVWSKYLKELLKISNKK